MSRYRNYILTVNNPVSTEYKFPEWVSYALWQEEKAPTTGTLHHQMYVECNRAVNFSTIKDLFPTAHIEPRRGTQEDAIGYCSKEETRVSGPYSYGCPKRQGKRSDIIEVVTAIESGDTLKELVKQFPIQFATLNRGMMFYYGLQDPPKRDNVEVEVYWGPPGVGKSRLVHDKYSEAYCYLDNYNGWFDGYSGQDVVILDEFQCHMPIGMFLKLIDRYPTRMPVKGGYVPIHATKFIFTSNLDPLYWYKSDPAVQRRLTKVIHMVSAEVGEDISLAEPPPTSEARAASAP